MDALKVWRGQLGETTMTTGPNDARCVVWALGEFFLNFLCVFFYRYLMI